MKEVRKKVKLIEIKGRIVSDGIVNMYYDWLNIPYTSPQKIKNALNDANGEDIEVHINSLGGSVYAGYEIYNLLCAYTGNITIKIVGIAASAASFISQVPKSKCYMSPLSQMMIHCASSCAEGTSKIMDETSQMLQVTDDTIAQAYVLKTGKTKDEMLELMKNETFFTPQQAFDLGLVDGILGESTKQETNVYNSLDDDLLTQLEQCKNEQEIKDTIRAHMQEFRDNLFKIDNNLQNNLKKGDDDVEIKTIEDLKNTYPDLVNEALGKAMTDAVNKERERIQSINNLIGKGPKDLIEQGITDGLTAEQVALNILNNQTIINQQQLTNIQADANDSGINNVPSNQEPQKTNENNKQDAIDLLANAGNEIMKGMRQ